MCRPFSPPGGGRAEKATREGQTPPGRGEREEEETKPITEQGRRRTAALPARVAGAQPQPHFLL